jgi:hypothetical protein
MSVKPPRLDWIVPTGPFSIRCVISQIAFAVLEVHEGRRRRSNTTPGSPRNQATTKRELGRKKLLQGQRCLGLGRPPAPAAPLRGAFGPLAGHGREPAHPSGTQADRRRGLTKSVRVPNCGQRWADGHPT